jgi:DNA-directed RNA polymerase subunit H
MASQNTSSLISQIYKSRSVLLELMKKQGFSTKDYEGFSVNEVNTMKNNNQLDMILEKVTEIKGENDEKEEEENLNNDSELKTGIKIYIKYYLGKSLRPSNLQEMIDDLFMVEEVLTKKDTLLVVVKDEVNETLLNSVKHIWESEKIFIILLPLQRLQFNILEHILVPPHRVLDEAEKINVKNRYNIINDIEFPELSRFDPVAQAIGIRPGQVCEITRPSKTAILAPYYRICI